MSEQTNAADLRAFMQRMDWTPTQLGRHLGLSLPTIKRMLSGEREVPPYVGLACAAIHRGIGPYRAGQ